MFRVLPAVLVAVLLASLAWAHPGPRPDSQAPAATASPTPDPTTASADARATQLSNSLTALVGLGISPATTMAVLGLCDQRSHPDAVHTQFWFLFPISVLALTATLVQIFGAIPSPPFKQVIACLQVQERRISGMIAAGVLVPTVMGGLDVFGAGGSGAAPAAESHPLAMAGVAASANLLLAYLVMGLSWTISQTIEYLVFLSPFALLDWLLLSVRAALLGLLAAVIGLTHLLSPWVGLVILACMLAVFLIIGAWCLRLNLFAGAFATDLLLRRWRKPGVADGPLVAFLGGGSGLAPARVRCTVVREGDRVTLFWRRYFIGPRRQAELDASNTRLVRGVLWHDMETSRSGSRSFWLWLPPRYRVHHQTLADTLQVRLEDGSLLKGWAGVKGFFARLLSPRKRAAVATIEAKA